MKISTEKPRRDFRERKEYEREVREKGRKNKYNKKIEEVRGERRWFAPLGYIITGSWMRDARVFSGRGTHLVKLRKIHRLTRQRESESQHFSNLIDSRLIIEIKDLKKKQEIQIFLHVYLKEKKTVQKKNCFN